MLLMINGAQFSLIKRWDFYGFCALNQLYPHHYEFPLQLQMCLVLNDTSTVITDNCERLVATFRSLLQRATPENPIGNTYHSLYIYFSSAAVIIYHLRVEREDFWG